MEWSAYWTEEWIPTLRAADYAAINNRARQRMAASCRRVLAEVLCQFMEASGREYKTDFFKDPVEWPAMLAEVRRAVELLRSAARE